MTSTTSRTIGFATPWEKARYLDGAARLDAWQPAVQTLAERARRVPFAERAEAIHGYVRDRIRYVRDPLIAGTDKRREQFADAETVLRRGYDDCDGKSRLFVALCCASGIEARIRPIFIGGTNFTHVQAECRYPGSTEHRCADAEGWIVSETILRGVPLGSGAEAALRDHYGRIIYSGGSTA